MSARHNGGHRRRFVPDAWANQVQMRFGNILYNVREAAMTRDMNYLHDFVSQRSTLTDVDSFSKIISFDTECSVNYNDYCEMCSFGYAEYDLDGNELSREEIYIRAREPKGRLKEKCQADYSKFKDAPSWRAQYARIREVLTRKDTLYIAHGSKSDITFIMMMNRRLDTDQFYFRVFDTLEIFKSILPDMGKYNLSSLADALGIEHDAHVSLSDAIVCFRLLERAAKMNDLHLRELFSKYQAVSLSDSIDVLRDLIRGDRRRDLLRIKESEYNPIRGSLSGLRFASDEKMEKRDPEAILEFARHIVKNGGSYVSGVSNANVFVWDGDNNNHSYLYAMRLVRNGANLEILRVDEILDGRFGTFPDICWEL